MPTIIMIVALWLVLSVPLSVLLGMSFRDDTLLDLLGMDGDVAVFRRSDGAFKRVPLGVHAPT